MSVRKLLWQFAPAGYQEQLATLNLTVEPANDPITNVPNAQPQVPDFAADDLNNAPLAGTINSGGKVSLPGGSDVFDPVNSAIGNQTAVTTVTPGGGMMTPMPTPTPMPAPTPVTFNSVTYNGPAALDLMATMPPTFVFNGTGPFTTLDPSSGMTPMVTNVNISCQLGGMGTPTATFNVNITAPFDFNPSATQSVFAGGAGNVNGMPLNNCNATVTFSAPP